MMSQTNKLPQSQVPWYIGTVTETLQAIQLCKDNEWDVIVSHRSGETNDSFIALPYF